MNKRHTLFALLVILSLLLAACAGQPTEATTGGEEPAPTSAEPVQVRIGWAGSPDTLNPGTAVLTEAYTLFELVYDSMYQLNLDGSYSLELAESAEVSDDGITWTFKIRSGISWHDGQPLTANDIAFSYNFYQQNQDFAFLPIYTDYFASVEAPDDSTVVITLTEAIPNMESQLVFLYVLPQHIWGDLDSASAAEFENAAMVGTGPFKLVGYSQNEFVELEAVRNHPLYNAKIDSVVFRTYSNPDALVQALRTGEVDMITEMPNTAVPGLRAESNIEVVTGAPAAPSVSDIIFNLTDESTCPVDDGGECTGHPALRDRQVRLALAHATDKQKIIDVVLLGLGSPGTTLIPDGLGVWYNDAIVDYEFNVDLANQILEDAGYLDTDADGIREMPGGGDPLVFRLNWPSDSTTAPREAELLDEMWTLIGVDLELQALDPDTLTAVCCPVFDFDIIIWGWGSDPDPGFLLSVMTTGEIPTGTSETGYSNPAYDELYVAQATELDLQTRIGMVHEMQQIVFDDIVYLIPFYDQSVQAFRTDRFTGWITDQPKVALEDVSSLLVIEPAP